MVDYFTMQKAIRATKEDGEHALDQFERRSDADPWHESSHRADDTR